MLPVGTRSSIQFDGAALFLALHPNAGHWIETAVRVHPDGVTSASDFGHAVRVAVEWREAGAFQSWVRRLALDQ